MKAWIEEYGSLLVAALVALFLLGLFLTVRVGTAQGLLAYSAEKMTGEGQLSYASGDLFRGADASDTPEDTRLVEETKRVAPVVTLRQGMVVEDAVLSLSDLFLVEVDGVATDDALELLSVTEEEGKVDAIRNGTVSCPNEGNILFSESGRYRVKLLAHGVHCKTKRTFTIYVNKT